ncbi:MAG: dipeptidase [Hyphomicrobiales bacterium]
MKRNLLLLFFLLLASTYSFACTIIAVGKKATADGSVIVSHSDAGPDCRLHVVKGQKYKEGSMMPVYWGMIESGRPLGDYGDTLGFIPQARETYTYFHTAYPQMNVHQLSIAESTLSQRAELKVDRATCKQIMTIEQAQAIALQRCKKSKDAVKLIGQLMDMYGFLPSCVGESESLVIADPNEIWVFEVFSVGQWDPKSGKAGAIWAAKRVPDDHAMVIANWSVIKEVHPEDTANYMASDNYMDFAINMGWYNPKDNKPFIWQDIYSPIPREWATSRLWLFYSTYAPNYKQWPERKKTSPYQGLNQYVQFVEPISIYPFSVRPERKMDIQDVKDFQRSTFTGTIYDKEDDPAWYKIKKDNTLEHSPMATPFPTKESRELLRITQRRNVARARGEYGMIAKLRSWLPDEIGGLYYFYVDNAYTSAYTPIYCGVSSIIPEYKTYDPKYFQENSLRWNVDFVDNLMYLRWQDASKHMKQYRDSLEVQFEDERQAIENKALELYNKSPKKASKYLTEITHKRMKDVMTLFKKLRLDMISKWTNNKQGI